MDEFSDNKDNNDIWLFIGWHGMKNEKLRRLIPQIRGWHVLPALSERHNYPLLMMHAIKAKHLWQLRDLSTILTTYKAGGNWWGKFWTNPRKGQLNSKLKIVPQKGRSYQALKGTISPYEGWSVPTKDNRSLRGTNRPWNGWLVPERDDQSPRGTIL